MFQPIETTAVNCSWSHFYPQCDIRFLRILWDTKTWRLFLPLAMLYIGL